MASLKYGCQPSCRKNETLRTTQYSKAGTHIQYCMQESGFCDKASFQNHDCDRLIISSFSKFYITLIYYEAGQVAVFQK